MKKFNYSIKLRNYFNLLKFLSRKRDNNRLSLVCFPTEISRVVVSIIDCITKRKQR